MNIQYGIREDIGFGATMEDGHAIYDNEERSFFSAEIYDGHGGRRPAEIAAEMLTPAFLHARDMEMKKPAFSRRSEAVLLGDAGSGDNIIIIVLDLRNCTAGLKNRKMKITGIYDRAES